jgi:hypothetical protein
LLIEHINVWSYNKLHINGIAGYMIFFRWSKAVIYKCKCKIFCIISVYVNIVLLFAMIKSHWWKWKLGYVLTFIWKECLKLPMFWEWNYIGLCFEMLPMENCKLVKVPGTKLREELCLNSWGKRENEWCWNLLYLCYTIIP